MKHGKLLASVLGISMSFGCGGTKEEPVAPAQTTTAAATPTNESTQKPSPQNDVTSPQDPVSPTVASPVEPTSDDANAASPKPDSTASSPKVETRTKSVISDIVKQNRGAVRQCYEKALKQQPGITGNLVVSFTINPKGKVTKASVDADRSTISIPELDTCAINVLLGLTFPASSRGRESSVDYPFNFVP